MTDSVGALLDARLSEVEARLALLEHPVTPPPAPVPPPTPPIKTPFDDALVLWEQHMVGFGKAVSAGTQMSTYYDSARVYYQMADYTKDASWNDCAKAGVVAYRDGYLKPNNFAAAGWDIFPHGLLMDWQRTSDQASKDALLGLAVKSAYAPSYPLTWTASADASREVAYNLGAKRLAMSLGATVWGFDDQLAQAFDHVRQWTAILNGQPSGTAATYVRPFMTALTAEALIQYAGDDKDKVAKVLAALQPLFDQLWYICYLPDSQSLAYTDKQSADNTGGRSPAPDLNLLIAPVYAWLYRQTQLTIYRDHADALFIGGVRAAYLGEGKQFNQNYRWSFDYLKWRA